MVLFGFHDKHHELSSFTREDGSSKTAGNGANYVTHTHHNHAKDAPSTYSGNGTAGEKVGFLKTLTGTFSKLSSSTPASSYCFSACSLVMRENGRTCKMSDLSIGDQVVSYSGTFGFASSTIVGFLHRDVDCVCDSFVKINFLSDKSLLITRDHLVFVRDRETGRLRDIPAGNIDIQNHQLLSIWIDWSTQDVDIESIEYNVKRIGVFAPLTESGTLVVQGVGVSCYANPFNFGDELRGGVHDLFNATMWPLRSSIVPRYYSENLQGIHPGADKLLSVAKQLI